MIAALLGCTLQELDARMSAEEFAVWELAIEKGVIGELGAWLRCGIVASTVANYAGKMRAESAGAASPADYIPDAVSGRTPRPAPESDPAAFLREVYGHG